MRHRFVVTGCARSGTGHLAKILQAAGIECGHEGAFGPPQILDDVPPSWNELDGDVSWLAMPLLPQADVSMVGLQARHPLEVIRSLCGMKMLSDCDSHGRYLQAIKHTAPEVFGERTEPNRAARYWLEWTARARSIADLTWRVEELCNRLAFIGIVAALTNRTVVAEQLEEMKAVPHDYNAHTYSFMHRDESVTWGDIRSPLMWKVKELAGELGYAEL
jgi:hypothetical protein